MQISCFSSYLSPRILVSILPEAVITVMFVWWWFFFVTSTFSNFKEELSVFPYLFIPLLTLMWTYRYLFYSMSCNLIVHFVALNCSRFGYWECLQVGSRVLNMPPLFFEHGFAFWHHNVFQAHLVLSQLGFLWPETWIFSWGFRRLCHSGNFRGEKWNVGEKNVRNSYIVICRVQLLLSSAVARNEGLPEFYCQHPLRSFGIQLAILFQNQERKEGEK